MVGRKEGSYSPFLLFHHALANVARITMITIAYAMYAAVSVLSTLFGKNVSSTLCFPAGMLMARNM